jgi:molybdate transport system ATP-binding protein
MLEIELHKQRGEFKLDVAFTAPNGSIVALFGPSGCGKSTTIDLIAGLLEPDRGRIEVNGRVLFDLQRGIHIAAERRRIGYVFQDARLFPHLTAEQNLRYGLRRARPNGEGIEFAPTVDLLGLGALLQRRPHQLSGGERQRVAIGRALLSQPRLLLLDEPLAALDFARRDEVLPYLERLRNYLRIPMVYVSHQFDEVLRLATHVVLMDRGQSLAAGSLTSISMHPSLSALIGVDAIGAVVEARVDSVNESTGLALVTIGRSQVHIDSAGLVSGQGVRLQLLARDLILAVEPPRGLSVRNVLEAVVTRLSPDEQHATLVELDAGGVTLLSRITTPAATQLRLKVGSNVWVLVKTMTLRGHVFPSPPDAPFANARALKNPSD